MRFLLTLALASLAFGQVNQTTNRLGTTDNYVVAFEWTADGTGFVPPTQANTAPFPLVGYQVTQIEIKPRTPAPTSGYTIKITDASGNDLLANNGASLSPTAATAYVAGPTVPPLNGTFSLVITGQSVAGAKGTVYVFLGKPLGVDTGGSGLPSGPSGGDLGCIGSTYPNPKVCGINGVNLLTLGTGYLFLTAGVPTVSAIGNGTVTSITTSAPITGGPITTTGNIACPTCLTNLVTISTTSPLTGGGDLSANRTFAIDNAAADGVTKGAATFAAADFNSALGVISLDYTNGQKATNSVPGFLSAADHATFSAAASGITALTGDGTATGPGSVALTLATVNAGSGSCGSATVSCIAVTNAKGLVTSQSTATITPAVGSITGLGTGVATWLATPSGANLASALTTSLPNTKGGTGGDSSGGTGLAHVSAGTWSYSAVVSADLNITTTTCANQFIRSLSSGAVGTCAAITATDLGTTLTPRFARLGLGQAADGTATLAATQGGIGATSTDGYILQNTTAAAAGAQQFSPRIRLTGFGWKTNATAASQEVDWIVENQPVQAAAAPDYSLVFSSQVNAGGYKRVLTVGDVLGSPTTGALWLKVNGTPSATNYALANDSTGNITVNAETGGVVALSVNSVVGLTASASAIVVTAGLPVQTVEIAVGSLPTCNAGAAGSRSSVNDSNAASFTAGIGAVVAAGGTTHVPVYCDGTNWRIG